MKLGVKIFTVLLLLALLLTPASAAFAKGAQDGRVVMGEAYTLKSGETLEGDLVVLGGTVAIEQGATVKGNLAVIGGSLAVNGTVEGDIALIGGSVSLAEHAVVKGDIAEIGGALHRAEGAVVEGQIVNGGPGPVIEIGGVPSSLVPPIVAAPPTPIPDIARILNTALDPFAQLGGLLLRSVLLGALAMLLMLFLQEPTERVATAASRQGALAGGMGLLTLVIAPFALLLMVITLILIPVAALAVLALGVAVIFGWISLGLEVGQRFTQMLKVNWPVPVAAGLGTFLLTVIANGLAFIPCVGWLAPVVLGFIGLGAVVMTRFGTRMVLPPLAPSPIVAAAPAEVSPPPAAS